MVSLQPSDFIWFVGTNGHDWINARAAGSDSEELFLSDLIPVGSTGYRPTRPLRDHSGLFREFAATPRDKDSIKAFADRNGLLGGPGRLPIPIRKRSDGKGAHLGAGESYSHWRREIAFMLRCVELYDHARKANLEALEPHIQWYEDSVGYMSHPNWNPGDELPSDETVTFDKIVTGESGRFQSLKPGDLVTPALWHVQSEINKRLAEHASPRLLWDIDKSELVNRIIPSSLLGAMWLQFALSVERKSEFRQCSHCGKWFEIARSTARSDKQFCSTVCRVKAFRQRKLRRDTQEEPSAKTPTMKRTAGPPRSKRALRKSRRKTAAK